MRFPPRQNRHLRRRSARFGKDADGFDGDAPSPTSSSSAPRQPRCPSKAEFEIKVLTSKALPLIYGRDMATSQRRRRSWPEDVAETRSDNKVLRKKKSRRSFSKKEPSSFRPKLPTCGVARVCLGGECPGKGIPRPSRREAAAPKEAGCCHHSRPPIRTRRTREHYHCPFQVRN